MSISTHIRTSFMAGLLSLRTDYTGEVRNAFTRKKERTKGRKKINDTLSLLDRNPRRSFNITLRNSYTVVMLNLGA
jgi:hypothetical protein